jgi:hypothetical protein
VRTLRHQQDPQRIAQARAELATLNKQGAQAGELTLAYLDGCSFAPSQPVTSSWTAPGVRKRVRYENPCGRRVNAIGVLIEDGPAPGLFWETATRPLTSQDLLPVLQALPRPQRLVVVLDNGSIHVSRVIKDAVPALRAQGIEPSSLLPDSPELNAIEAVFGGMAAHGFPERRSPSVPALLEAVDPAFTEAAAGLLSRQHPFHTTQARCLVRAAPAFVSLERASGR